MSENEALEGRIGATTPSKVTEQERQGLRDLLKKEYEARSTAKQLEDALFQLQVTIQYSLNSGTKEEVPPVGDFIERGMQLYKDIAKVSKKQLARIWGLQDSNLRKYIKGTRPLAPALARKIAISFNLPHDLLLRVDLENTNAKMKQLQDEEPATNYSVASILQQCA